MITFVARDDLKDGGARFWATTIKMVKLQNPDTTIEVLIPDFDGHPEYLQLIIDAAPDVISHNLETVRRLTPVVRNNAYYDRSLDVVTNIAQSGIVAKSGIMLGLGETEKEVLEAMNDLRKTGCKVITIGQYLQPASHLKKVVEFVKPDQFEFYRNEGLKLGYSFVESHPLVRSSYHAERHVNA